MGNIKVIVYTCMWNIYWGNLFLTSKICPILKLTLCFITSPIGYKTWTRISIQINMKKDLDSKTYHPSSKVRQINSYYTKLTYYSLMCTCKYRTTFGLWWNPISAHATVPHSIGTTSFITMLLCQKNSDSYNTSTFAARQLHCLSCELVNTTFLLQ